MIKIIHTPTETEPFLVLDKPPHVPTAPLFEGDESILTEAMKEFPEIALVCGKKSAEHGLVHRIDTETRGLVLIATTQESYDSLILSQKNGLFEKWYRAEVDFLPGCAEILGGFPPVPEKAQEIQAGETFTVKSEFRAFGKKGSEVRPVTIDSGRAARKKGGSVLYETEISLAEENVALCRIKSGFRHQVRCHLSWCGFPVNGDKIYNPASRDSKNDSEMKFTAFKIRFPHPFSQIPLTFQT